MKSMAVLPASQAVLATSESKSLTSLLSGASQICVSMAVVRADMPEATSRRSSTATDFPAC
ncbi:hypothetical protein D3C86_1357670 [compost metagenome]